MEALQQAYASSSEESDMDTTPPPSPTPPVSVLLPASLSASHSPLSSSPDCQQLHEDEGGTLSPTDKCQELQEDNAMTSALCPRPAASAKGASPPSPAQSSSSGLPPPPSDLLNSSNSSPLPWIADTHHGRVRSFPHVEGNFALHVYISVPVSSIAKRILEPMVEKALTMAQNLEPIMAIDVPTYPMHAISKEILHVPKLAKEYHISLSRTVPIRVHQIDSIVPMLRHRFVSQKRFWLDFYQWAIFVNDDRTRSFLSLEVVAKGMFEICRQIHSVNEIFRLHSLPAFYENPRPHISVAWALGNETPSLNHVAEELNKLREEGANSQKACIWSHLFSKIECKIGSQTYCIWKGTMQA